MACVLVTALVTAGDARPSWPNFASSCGGTPTLRDSAKHAKLIVVGSLTNPKPDRAAPGGGTTDLRIEATVRLNPIIAGLTTVTLPRYVSVDGKSPPRYLIFCDVLNGKLDPYRGVKVKSAAVADYLKAAIALKADAPVGSLTFFGNALSSDDPAISDDAYRELGGANDGDLAKAAKRLDSAQLRKVLGDSELVAPKLSMAGRLLGGCGRPADADFLAGCLCRLDQFRNRGAAGILAGTMQLRPAAGWALVRGRIGDARRPLHERIDAMIAVDYFLATVPTPPADEAVRALAPGLSQDDIADLVIDRLRRWQLWDLTGDVLAAYGRKASTIMVKRTVLRYAIQCPKPEAKALVAEIRRTDPELLFDLEEMLALETLLNSGQKTP